MNPRKFMIMVMVHLDGNAEPRMFMNDGKLTLDEALKSAEDMLRTNRENGPPEKDNFEIVTITIVDEERVERIPSVSRRTKRKPH